MVDVTDPFSLFKLDRWILSIEESGPSEKVCKVVLVLTKTELEKQIDMVIFKEIAKKYNLDYYEVSSKTGKNIKEMFDKVIWEALALKNKSYFEKISESLKSLDDYHLKSTKESLETCSFSEGISLSSCNNIARDVRKKKGDNNDCSC